jgi:hypothetical protein
VRDRRPLIDDAEVTLSFYGSIVYLAVVSSLGAQREPPPPAVAISAVVAAATVLYVAHVFASLVPKAAKAGRLHRADLAASLRHDLPLLVSVIVPAIPLAAAATGVLADAAAYQLSVRLTMLLLFGLTLSMSRRSGLTWGRSVGAGLVILAITIAVTWLESHVH